MRIGEVAGKSGVPASTLRYYEEIGLIPAPVRVSGQRHYDAGIFSILHTIQTAQQAGFTLREIREMMQHDDWRSQWHQMAREKLVDVKQAIAHYRDMQSILEMSLQCTCSGPDDCMVLVQRR
ncbi:MAG: MerR family transcriptional regulator [Chloroflexota bacterium]